jgi:hypothetical protein
MHEKLFFSKRIYKNMIESGNEGKLINLDDIFTNK